MLNTQCRQNAVPSHDSGDFPGNWLCGKNLPRQRDQISSSNNEARVNNTVNSTEYFGTSPIDNFNGSYSTVPCKTQPIDSLARFPYRFLVICDPASPRSGFTASETLLPDTWRSLSMDQPSSRKIASHMP